MFIGNIVTTDEINEENFNIVESLDKCIPTLPTLIIGWKITKTLFNNTSILHKQLEEDKWWTFNSKERKVDLEQDLDSFKTLCYNNIGKNIKYVYIDILYHKKNTIKKIITKIKSFNNILIYVSNTNMLYIFDENIVFGLDLNIVEFIGIKKEKIINSLIKLPHSIFIRNEIFNKCMSIIKKIDKKDKLIPYIYRYGECNEDNHTRLFCSE